MKTLFTLLSFYYTLIGKKLFWLFFLMFMGVGFQGLSVSLFLPILQGDDPNSKFNQLIKKMFDFLGVEYTLTCLLVFLTVFFFLRSLFLVGQASYTSKIMADLLVNLRCNMAEKIFQMDYQAFLKKSSGHLNNALIVEFQNAVFSFKMFAGLAVNILFAVMYLGIPVFMNLKLILILMAVGVPIFFIIKKINGLTRKYSIQASSHSASLQKIIIESLKYFKYLKATERYPDVLKQIFFQSRILGKLQFRTSALGAITSFGFDPVIVLVLVGTIFYFVIMQGQEIVENLFLFFLLYNAMRMILSTQQNFRKLLSSWGSIAVLEKLGSDLDELKETSKRHAGDEPVSFNKPLRLENIGFSFDNDTNVLKNINIEISPNSTVAFVGDSGAGKTTLVNIIIGLLRPTEGEIYSGQRAYGDIGRQELRKCIGYITQENVIFNDTIYNNITLWDPDESEKNMQKAAIAAKKAHIADFIEKREKGYDSLLGEGGINISGGQRQRLCIARELYKNAEMLVFDEATSSLDTKTEREIQKNIDEFKGEKTIVIVAHRLSTVRNSDKIFVLKKGEVVENGSYEELLSLKGEFTEMVRRQNS